MICTGYTRRGRVGLRTAASGDQRLIDRLKLVTGGLEAGLTLT